MDPAQKKIDYKKERKKKKPYQTYKPEQLSNLSYLDKFINHDKIKRKNKIK